MAETRATTRSSELFVRLLFGGVVFAGGAIWALVSGHWGWAIGIAVMGLLAAFGMSMETAIRKAPCPTCGSDIFLPGGDMPLGVLCQGCRGYFRVERGTLSPLPLDTISATPYFAAPTPWPDLKDCVPNFRHGEYLAHVSAEEQRVMNIEWPPNCCVCDRPQQRYADIVFTLLRKNKGVIANYTAINVVVPGLPYCDMHSEGAVLKQQEPLEGVPYENLEFSYVLKFPSYSFRNRVLALNRWPWV